MRLLKIYAVAVMVSLSNVVGAAGYPAEPIKLIVPYSPGGGTDTMARLLGKELSDELKVPVVIENKPGAAGNIGTSTVARAESDGYTLLFTSSGHVINPSLFANLPFDPLKDFTPIAQLAVGPSVLVVNANSNFKSVSQLIESAKAKEGLTFGSAGLGQPTHIAAEKFAVQANAKVVHIPYKGSGAAELGLAAGDIDFLVDSIPAALPFIRSNKTRALAVSGAKRFPLLKDVPTLDESGLKGFSFVTWWGIMAPKNLPVERVQILEKAIAKAMSSSMMQERFIAMGAEPELKGPQEFKTYIASELGTYKNLISTLGIQPNN